VKEKVYIILLNYKGWKDSIECLESVLKLNYYNFQIIVVDNSPTLESVSSIKSWATDPDFREIPTAFPKIVDPLYPKPLDYIIISESESKNKFYEETLLIIKADKNLGFSAGNNIAMNYAMRREDYGYCWILNNDTVVDKNALQYQIDYMRKNTFSKIGILGSKLIYYFEANKIQAIGGAFNPFSYTTKHLGEGMSVNTGKQKFRNIDYVIGASMLVSNDFLKDVGVLSEDYFLYYEEIDWKFRAAKKGWSIDWCEKSLVFHKEGSSIGSSSYFQKRSSFSELNVFKSRKIFFQKFSKNKIFFWLTSLLIIFNRFRRFQLRLGFSFLKILITK
tara:strand:- start:3174 stop:4172 length:999 start_codon:yes stop_codon:yes gene_type:complete